MVKLKKFFVFSFLFLISFVSIQIMIKNNDNDTKTINTYMIQILETDNEKKFGENTSLSFSYDNITNENFKLVDQKSTRAIQEDNIKYIWISFLILLAIVLIIVISLYFILNKRNRYKLIKERSEKIYEKFIILVKNSSLEKKFEEYLKLAKMSDEELNDYARIELGLEFPANYSFNKKLKIASLLTEEEFENVNNFIKYDITNSFEEIRDYHNILLKSKRTKFLEKIIISFSEFNLKSSSKKNIVKIQEKQVIDEPKIEKKEKIIKDSKQKSNVAKLYSMSDALNNEYQQSNNSIINQNNSHDSLMNKKISEAYLSKTSAKIKTSEEDFEKIHTLAYQEEIKKTKNKKQKIIKQTLPENKQTKNKKQKVSKNTSVGPGFNKPSQFLNYEMENR